MVTIPAKVPLPLLTAGAQDDVASEYAGFETVPIVVHVLAGTAEPDVFLISNVPETCSPVWYRECFNVANPVFAVTVTNCAIWS